MLEGSGPIPFGRRLQDLLDQRGTDASQAWLATRSGVDRSLISRIIRGERPPSGETLRLLAPVLQVSVTELARGTDAEERLEEAVDHVRRSDYESAVAQLIEFERRNRDLDQRVRSLAETLEEERRGHRATERRALAVAALLEASKRELSDQEMREERLQQELERYQHALERAVAAFSTLQAQLEQVRAELSQSTISSRTASVLAGIAAGTGVATLAYFLDNEPAAPPPRRRARPKKRRTR